MSFLLINKPKNITSHDVIDRMRRITGIKKIGHAGTLDPNATGLLVVGITRQSTKLLHQMTTGFSKTYEAEITLGETRDTLDIEGEITSQNPDIKPDLAEIEKTVKSFLGKQKQIPPAHSAIKIKGKKAYDLARVGKPVKLESRDIEIKNIKLLKYDYPVLRLSVEVSAGTYIRSLARDIGDELGTGAYLSNLTRTRVGKYDLKDAKDLDEISPENWQEFSFKYDE